MIRILSVFLLSLSLCFSLTSGATANDDGQENTSPVLEFREPAGSNLASYIRQVLAEAYGQLDVDLRYVTMPRARSLVEANEGRIAGEVARVPMLEDTYSNLIRIDVPLYTFEIMLVADRRECGICDFESLENLAYVNGVRKVEDFLKSQTTVPETFEARDNEQLFSLLEGHRVQAALMTNFDYQQSGLRNNRYYIALPLERSRAFHYLHRSHQQIAERLQLVLQQMNDSGRLARLREHYAIDVTPEQEPFQVSDDADGVIRIITGDWTGLAQPNGEGAYWDLMREIFAPLNIKLELNASTFNRAMQSLVEQRYDVMLGNYQGQEPATGISSLTHMDWDPPLYAFTRTEADMAQLEAGTLAKPVCYERGYDYQEFLPESLDFYAADGPLDCFAMLDLGRAGAVTDYRENMPEWAEGPYQELELHPGLPLHAAFQDTEQGHKLRAFFDQRLREIIRSGRIQDFYSQERVQRANFNIRPPLQSSAVATPRR